MMRFIQIHRTIKLRIDIDIKYLTLKIEINITFTLTVHWTRRPFKLTNWINQTKHIHHHTKQLTKTSGIGQDWPTGRDLGGGRRLFPNDGAGAFSEERNHVAGCFSEKKNDRADTFLNKKMTGQRLWKKIMTGWRHFWKQNDRARTFSYKKAQSEKKMMGQELILRYGVVSFYGEKMRGRSLFKPKNVLLPMGCSVNLPPSLNRKIGTKRYTQISSLSRYYASSPMWWRWFLQALNIVMGRVLNFLWHEWQNINSSKVNANLTRYSRSSALQSSRISRLTLIDLELREVGKFLYFPKGFIGRREHYTLILSAIWFWDFGNFLTFRGSSFEHKGFCLKSIGTCLNHEKKKMFDT